MRILVTGGAGYVGGFAARRLLASDHDVVVLDNLSTGHRAGLPQETLVVGDVGERAVVDQILSQHRIEAVMHFAASAYVGESVRDPRGYYRNNVVNTLTLLEAMLDHDVKRLVFSSTCAVYAETEEMPLNEDSAQAPLSPYAFSKGVIERMIADFSRAYGLDYVLLRYFNAAGASPDGMHGEDHRPETHLLPLALQIVLGKRRPAGKRCGAFPPRRIACSKDIASVIICFLLPSDPSVHDGVGQRSFLSRTVHPKRALCRLPPDGWPCGGRSSRGALLLPATRRSFLAALTRSQAPGASRPRSGTS